MSCLIVVAHPDDEILGAGATICKLVRNGEDVHVCILSSKAEARQFKPSDDDLQDDCALAISMLGVKSVIKGEFPNIKLNTVPHLELVQFIEKCVIDTGADILYTHHPSDLNNDHVQTSLACQAAARLFQRNKEIKPLKALLYMEVLSSTEWALNDSANYFRPNVFVQVGEDAVDLKIKALAQYRGVMRDYPHPRSKEVIKALSVYRGSQSGCNYAEAFELAFWREQ